MDSRISKNGFTMVEMLVVIGIIVVLMGALAVSVSGVTKTANKARDQELVSNAAAALAIMHQDRGSWPPVLVQKAQGEHLLDKEVVRELKIHAAKYRPLLGVSKNEDLEKGPFRCGIVDDIAAATLKKKSSNNEQTRCGTAKRDGSPTVVKDHILRFSVDYDDDGFTEADVAGKHVKVRAPAIVWCLGANGEEDDRTKVGSAKSNDDTYSWRADQEKK